MKIIIRYPSATIPNLNIRTVRLWGEPVMVKDGYSVTVRLVNGEPMGQFGLVQVYQLINGTYSIDSANQTAANLSHTEIMAIAALQTPDEFTVEQKMGWLTDGGDGDFGAVMKCTGDWKTATDIKQISAVYAGQPVEILEERVFRNVRWNGGVEAEVLMSRIKPGTLQKVTVVDAADRYGEEPKGVIWLPLKFKGSEAWIFNRWLV